VQRLEEQEKRKEYEKRQRIVQHEVLYSQKKAEEEIIAARIASKMLLKNLIPNVMTALTSNGYFYDSIEKEVVQIFLPWLSTQVTQQLDDEIVAYLILDGTFICR